MQIKKAAAVLAAFMLLFTGCSKGNDKANDLTPEEMTQLYESAIEGARTEEENTGTPVITTADNPDAEMVFPLIGFDPADAQAYAISISPWNISAYGIAIITPTEENKQAVLDNINAFVEQQQNAFKDYLPDQYENAKNAVVETLEDGTVIMVMCPDQDTVFDSIKEALENE